MKTLRVPCPFFSIYITDHFSSQIPSFKEFWTASFLIVPFSYLMSFNLWHLFLYHHNIWALKERNDKYICLNSHTYLELQIILNTKKGKMNKTKCHKSMYNVIYMLEKQRDGKHALGEILSRVMTATMSMCIDVCVKGLL